MKRTAVTERDILDAVARGCARLEIPHDALVTPLAADTAAARKLVLVRSAPPPFPPPSGESNPARGAASPGTSTARTGFSHDPQVQMARLQPSAGQTTPERNPASGQTPLHGAPSQPSPPTASGTGQQFVVAIGSDHGGFEMKTQLAAHIRARGFAVEDAGTSTSEPCDYPDFAYAVGLLVSSGRAKLGIMIDGAGIGSCMVVNKIPGIRGACCTHEFMARNAREHNNANILTLGSRVVGLEVAKAVVDTFLGTSFAGGRHEGRVQKIMDVDRKYRRG